MSANAECVEHIALLLFMTMALYALTVYACVSRTGARPFFQSQCEEEHACPREPPLFQLKVVSGNIHFAVLIYLDSSANGTVYDSWSVGQH